MLPATHLHPKPSACPKPCQAAWRRDVVGPETGIKKRQQSWRKEKEKQWKTLYLADSSSDKGDFLKLLKKSGYGKIYDRKIKRMKEYDLNPDEFPITRFIELSDNQPLGWVKLELK